MKQISLLKVQKGGIETESTNDVDSNLTTEINFHVTHAFSCIIYDTFLNIPIWIGRIIQPKSIL